MKTAIVHEWLTKCAGSEKVLEQIVHLFPDSDIYSLCDFLPDSERGFLKEKNITTSFIQKIPFARKRYRELLPLMPIAIKGFDLSSYDLIISNAHSVAKGVRKYPGQLHICYCHTPMRYVWDLQHQYLKGIGCDRGLRSLTVKTLFNRIRRWDLITSRNVDHLVTNSRYIRNRIQRAYHRDAQVIYPPVDIHSFFLSQRKDDFFVTVSRMVPYKRVDIIVEAFSRSGHPLVVIGDGPALGKIMKQAKKNIQFMGHLKDDVLRIYLEKARALIYAAEEDFGIVPVEAQACGTPVIAFGQGGVTETVVPLKRGLGSSSQSSPPTGIFFELQTPDSLIDAVKEFESHEDEFDAETIRNNVVKFETERFRREFKEFVDTKMREFFR